MTFTLIHRAWVASVAAATLFAAPADASPPVHDTVIRHGLVVDGSGRRPFVGDVAIDVPYASRQARRQGHSLDREVQILLAHGILHLLGHDHEADDGTMFALQRRLVRRVFGPGPDGAPATGRSPVS